MLVIPWSDPTSLMPLTNQELLQMRDIMMVLNKLKFVMWPRGGGIQQLGKDCMFSIS